MTRELGRCRIAGCDAHTPWSCRDQFWSGFCRCKDSRNAFTPRASQGCCPVPLGPALPACLELFEPSCWHWRGFYLGGGRCLMCFRQFRANGTVGKGGLVSLGCTDGLLLLGSLSEGQMFARSKSLQTATCCSLGIRGRNSFILQERASERAGERRRSLRCLYYCHPAPRARLSLLAAPSPGQSEEPGAGSSLYCTSAAPAEICELSA